MDETNDDDTSDDYGASSPTSPLDQRDRPLLSASDDSLASTMTDVSIACTCRADDMTDVSAALGAGMA